MSTIYPSPPRITGEDDGPDIEVLFAEARAHARRRRIRRVVLVVILTAALVGAGVTYHALFGGQRRSVGQTGAAPGPGPATSFPSTFVGYSVTNHSAAYPGSPLSGGIQLFATSTGKPIRTIVPVRFWPAPTNFANLGSGFQLSDDGSTVYYDETIGSDAPLRIEAVSVEDGTSRSLTTGSGPAVSPDNTVLAYRPVDPGVTDTRTPTAPVIGILDLRSGSQKSITVPGMTAGQAVQYAWLPGSHQLVIATTDVRPRPAAVPAGGSPIVKDPAFTSRAQVYDTDSGTFANLPSSTAQALEQTATSAVTITGPGRQTGEVRVAGTRKTTGSDATSEVVGTLNVGTGRLVWQHTLPSGDFLAWPAALAGQSSGQHFLVQNGTSLEPFAWTPASGRPPTPIATRLFPNGIAPTS